MWKPSWSAKLVSWNEHEKYIFLLIYLFFYECLTWRCQTVSVLWITMIKLLQQHRKVTSITKRANFAEWLARSYLWVCVATLSEGFPLITESSWTRIRAKKVHCLFADFTTETVASYFSVNFIFESFSQAWVFPQRSHHFST